MTQYIGTLTFDQRNKDGWQDHTKDRTTLAMDFLVMADWVTSVVDHYTQEIALGFCAAEKVIVSVFNVEDAEKKDAEPIDQVVINNPLAGRPPRHYLD